jgi:hypothetical protein
MHLQVRSEPALSPPDLAAYLAVLANAGINILAAGGSNLEHGGEFAFAVEDGTEEAAVDVLRAAGYRPRIVGVDLCWLTSDKPGQLLKCVDEVSRTNASSGRKIKDISIGVPDERGHIPIQLYSE